MVFIISKEEDHSTNDVIDWLIKWNIPYLRIGKRNFIESISVEIGRSRFNIYFDVNGKQYNFHQISFFWYRKYYLDLKNDFKLNHPVEFNESEYLNFLLLSELKTVEDFIIHKLEQKSYLGNHNCPNSNKLIAFSVAKSCGLFVPETYVSTEKERLYKTMKEKKEKKWIVKPIQDYFETKDKNENLKSYFSTITEIDTSYFDGFVNRIFPSCIQKEIPKKIEIRVFYIEGDMYSMAIFSQLDKQTKLDFRRYNLEKPNRCVPYSLPIDIEIKVKALMNTLKLNTGSLDFILTPENEYIFLEINPSGQYGMIEYNCFYPLNKRIAEKMKRSYEQKEN